MNLLRALFLHELASRHDAENRIGQALPRLLRASICEPLQVALRVQLDDAASRPAKLGAVFAGLGVKVRNRRCEATVGLLRDSESLVAAFEEGLAVDAALIAVIQKLRHGGIASYGCLRAWADTLGQTTVSGLLQGLLNEERAADQTLNTIARSCANPGALGARYGHLATPIHPDLPEPVAVRLEFSDAIAAKVEVAGTFNDWNPTAGPLHPSGGGTWLRELSLLPGDYEYCLLVDGRWMPDPRALETVPNPFGGRNSVLKVCGSPVTAHIYEATIAPFVCQFERPVPPGNRPRRRPRTSDRPAPST